MRAAKTVWSFGVLALLATVPTQSSAGLTPMDVTTERGGTYLVVTSVAKGTPHQVRVLLSAKPLTPAFDGQTKSWYAKEQETIPHEVWESKKRDTWHQAVFKDLEPDHEYHVLILPVDDNVTLEPYSGSWKTRRRIVTVEFLIQVNYDGDDGANGAGDFTFSFLMGPNSANNTTPIDKQHSPIDPDCEWAFNDGDTGLLPEILFGEFNHQGDVITVSMSATEHDNIAADSFDFFVTDVVLGHKTEMSAGPSLAERERFTAPFLKTLTDDFHLDVMGFVSVAYK